MTTNNPYLGKTATEPRPTAETWRGGNLEGRQAAWDAADAWRQDNDRLRAAHLAKVDAKEQADRDRAAAADDARALAKQAALAADLRSRFLAAGGTAAQWEAEKDGLLLAAIKRSALDGGDAARRAQAERTKAAF